MMDLCPAGSKPKVRSKHRALSEVNCKELISNAVLPQKSMGRWIFPMRDLTGQHSYHHVTNLSGSFSTELASDLECEVT